MPYKSVSHRVLLAPRSRSEGSDGLVDPLAQRRVVLRRREVREHVRVGDGDGGVRVGDALSLEAEDPVEAPGAGVVAAHQRGPKVGLNKN